MNPAVTPDMLLPAMGVAIVRPLFALAPLPLAGTKSLPPMLQASLALALAVFVFPRVALTADRLAPLDIGLLLLGEALVGLAIGLSLALTIAAARIAGELIGGAMGIGFASLVDPANGQAVPTVGQFMSLTAVALFMSLGGPVVLIGIIAESYRTIPPGSALTLDVGIALTQSGSTMFAVALRLAMPVIGATLLVQIVMGTMARLAPQLNMFAVGLPATLVVGLVVFALAFPVMGTAIASAWSGAFDLAATVAGAR